MRLIVGDDYAALPPQRQVGEIVAGAACPDTEDRARPDLGQAEQALESAGLRPAGRYLRRYPHQLTRFERQRVAFAIALATEPRLVLVDEPSTMLDAGRCHDLVEQLERLRAERNLAVLYLTHELELARRCCDRLVVLRGGRVVEHGPTERVCTAPEHPYTAELLSTGA
jgi:peptide/nickel transport system ATP-binding protein